MKRKFFSILFAVVLALSFSLVPSTPAMANTIASSNMVFEGDLADQGGGVYTGTVNMTNEGYYAPGGPGTHQVNGEWRTPDSRVADGGFDVYAKEGGTAYVQGMTPDNWTIGSDHDAYSVTGGPWGAWYDPDCADWYQYSLELTADHWYLRYTATGESPMSGTMTWYGDGTGYAAETDPGTVRNDDGSNPTDPLNRDATRYVKGSAQEWGWHCGWGEERIPLQFPGFNVQVTAGGSYVVTLTPAPVTVPLLADQNINVGTVSVWNDSTTLYVKYETTGGWEITKTHLAVATSLAGIPQNRAGNPKVGQFPHSTSHATPVTTYTYTITLPSGTPLYIAAHAKVVDAGNPMTMTVVSDTDTLVSYGNLSTPHNAVYAWEPGPLYPIDGPDDSGWEQNSLWDGAIDHTFSASTDWIWESYRVVNTVAGDVVDFEKAFSIPGNPTASTLHITCDNGYEVDVNGTIVGSAQVHGEWRTSDLTESFVNSQGWQSVESWDISGLLVPGQNTLEIDTANEHLSDGTISSNPAGLIFEAEITYLLQETAWGDGTRFVDRGNWATHFTYHVQGILTGTWLLDVNDGTYMHDMFIISQDSSGALSGTGGYQAGQSVYEQEWALTGQVDGTSVTITITYLPGPRAPYTTTLTGTIESDWNSMSGTGTHGVATWLATRQP